MDETDIPLSMWRKSRHSSANGQCVEAAFTDAVVMARDSKSPYGPALVFTPDTWDAFVRVATTP